MTYKKQPTSKDVAELAGVSRTTVSIVLNNKPGGAIRISEQTRRKVWEAVKELNYRPSSAAITLRTNRSNLIAVMVPHIVNPFHPLYAAVIQKELERSHREVIIYTTEESYSRQLDFIDKLISRGTDGVFIHSYNLTSDDIEKLVKAGIAVVINGDTPTHPFADNVVFNEVDSTFEIVDYLIKKGHSRIATIAGPSHTWAGTNRLTGYKKALEHHGLPIDENLIREANFYSSREAEECMENFLSLSSLPTAVLAASDFLGVNALLYAQDKGYKVPNDIAFVGFDDIHLAQITRPTLTTIRKDTTLLGKTAVQLLLERIENDTPIERRVKILNCELVFRNSA